MSTLSMEAINSLRDAAVSELNTLATMSEVERWRAEVLGRRGKLTVILQELPKTRYRSAAHHRGSRQPSETIPGKQAATADS